MHSRYITPKKASADQHAGIFFWSIYRTVIEFEADGRVIMYDEILAEPGLTDPKKSHFIRGKMTPRVSAERFEVIMLSDDSGSQIRLTVLELRDGQLIADIYSSVVDFTRAELFEPA